MAYYAAEKYFKRHRIQMQPEDIEDIAIQCIGVKHSHGLHPGGVLIVPKEQDINRFTPIRPAMDEEDLAATHIDYYRIERNSHLLKVDILEHKDPSMLHMLQDLTGVDPTEIPIDCQEILSLFRDTSSLHIKPEDIGGCTLATLGIPEFGTEFVMQILRDTKPKGISELIRISALGHGTGAWLDNAEKLIREGVADISSVIGSSDDIMLYLLNKGMDREQSYEIMEFVRMGKASNRHFYEIWDDWKQDMLKSGVPQWYISSCEKIQYLFPKAHAAAYVIMALRIAYYKVFHPLAFYAAYFSIRSQDFSYDIMCQGKTHLEEVMEQYLDRRDELSQEERDRLTDMKVAQEMYARGFDFMPVDRNKAEAEEFQIVDGKLMPPLGSIDAKENKDEYL